MDDADDGNMIMHEGNGDAEHGKAMREVYCAVEGVDDPGWAGIDEVVFGLAGGVSFLADEGVCWVSFRYCGVNKGLDLCEWVELVIDFGRREWTVSMRMRDGEAESLRRTGCHAP
jgi:hypothetical protein